MCFRINIRPRLEPMFCGMMAIGWKFRLRTRWRVGNGSGSTTGLTGMVLTLKLHPRLPQVFPPLFAESSQCVLNTSQCAGGKNAVWHCWKHVNVNRDIGALINLDRLTCPIAVTECTRSNPLQGHSVALREIVHPHDDNFGFHDGPRNDRKKQNETRHHARGNTVSLEHIPVHVQGALDQRNVVAIPGSCHSAVAVQIGTTPCVA